MTILAIISIPQLVFLSVIYPWQINVHLFDVWLTRYQPDRVPLEGLLPVLPRLAVWRMDRLFLDVIRCFVWNIDKYFIFQVLKRIDNIGFGATNLRQTRVLLPVTQCRSAWHDPTMDTRLPNSLSLFLNHFHWKYITRCWISKFLPGKCSQNYSSSRGSMHPTCGFVPLVDPSYPWSILYSLIHLTSGPSHTRIHPTHGSIPPVDTGFDFKMILLLNRKEFHIIQNFKFL